MHESESRRSRAYIAARREGLARDYYARQERKRTALHTALVVLGLLAIIAALFAAGDGVKDMEPVLQHFRK